MKMRLLIVCLILTVFAACTTSLSKTAFRDYYINTDWFALMKKIPEKEYWGNCFDISDEKLKMEVNTIYLECIERELQVMPSTITSNDERRFIRSVDACAINRFYSKQKDKFTFDKSPQYLDKCKQIYKIISVLK